jgi:GNAT superfamily N-acetyltransferase
MPPLDMPLRQATLDDLPDIGAFRQTVGWAPHDWAMRAQIAQADSIFLLAEDAGDIVGMGSGIAYPPSLGFVGNMIVAESHRRRGIGSAVLDAVVTWLVAQGCHRLELNATDEGRPLYERHGFVSRGTSFAAGVSRRAAGRLGPARPARRMLPADLERVAAFDRTRFGGDRARLLGLMLADGIADGWVVERGGEIEGFAYLQSGERRVGPMVADAPDVAAGLVTAVFEHDPEIADVRLNLPPGNVAGAEWLRRVRVARMDWDGRMAHGPDVPRRDDTIYQMTVGPLG